MKAISWGPKYRPVIRLGKPGYGVARAGSAVGLGVAASMVAALLVAPAAQATEVEPTENVTATVPLYPAGASSDVEAIIEKASGYDPGDPVSAAELAGAASAQESSQLVSVGGTMMSSSENGSGVQIGNAGEATLISPEGFRVGFGLPGDGESTDLVDGAVVHTEVTPSTDIVMRASENGAQMVAVLNDENASSEIDFPLELPSTAKLEVQPDGSVAVMNDVVVEQILPGEESRIEAEAAAIVGDIEDPDTLSDEQWEALDAIVPAQSVTATESQRVATMAAPWAVDANGIAVQTHYELDGQAIKQVVETGPNTAFPVTADPAWWWWVGTGATCAAQLGSFLFAAAKLAGLVAKATKIIKSSSALTKMAIKMGGMKAVVTRMYQAARGWAQGKATKYISATKLSELKQFIRSGKNLLIEGLGIGSCILLFSTL